MTIQFIHMLQPINHMMTISRRFSRVLNGALDQSSEQSFKFKASPTCNPVLFQGQHARTINPPSWDKIRVISTSQISG